MGREISNGSLDSRDRGSKTIFRRNVGGLDRAVRLTAGAVVLLIGLFLLFEGRKGLEIALIGGAILAMAIAGFCPFYIPFGISTARRRPNGTECVKVQHGSQLRGRAGGGSRL